MLLRSDAGGVAGVVELGSGGGSAEAARVGGDPGLARAGDELKDRARGATCSNADPKPGKAYGANRCALLMDVCKPGAGGGGGKEYCCSNGCRLNSSPGGICCGGKNGGGYRLGGYRYGSSGG